MDLTVIAILLGLLAVVYGFVTSRQVLGSSAGSEKMQLSTNARGRFSQPIIASGKKLSQIA